MYKSMLSIKQYFKETQDLVTEKDDKKSYRNNKYIKNINDLPEFNCPKEGSPRHQRDVDMIIWYYDNKSLSDGFLTASDDSVKKLFKMYCKDNNLNVNWKFLKEVLKDVHSITSTLKNKYRRPRPREYMSNYDKKYNDIIDAWSFSFPSGHTTTAYFLSNVISHFFPNHENDLKNLSSLIGHSRIENCVHYPSDVEYGQLLGEMLSFLFVKENLGIERELIHLKIKKKDRKSLVSELIKNNKSNIKNNFSDFLFLSGVCEDYNEINPCITDFLAGYPVDKCTKNKRMQSFLDSLITASRLEKKKNLFDYVAMHKTINESSLNPNHKPGMIRYYDRNINGYPCSKPKQIFRHVDSLNSYNPFSTYMLFNCIKPFCELNKIISAADLLHATDYNIERCNQFLESYPENLEKIKQKYETIDNIFM